MTHERNSLSLNEHFAREHLDWQTQISRNILIPEILKNSRHEIQKKKKTKIWVKCMDTIKFTNKQQLFLCCIRISTRCDVLHVACSNVACCCYKIETICRRFPILYLSWNNALTGFNMMRIRYSSSTRFIHRQFWFFPVLLGYNGRISVSLAINLLWMIFIS